MTTECPSEATLTEVASGQALSLHVKQVEEHAATCERCAALLVRLKASETPTRTISPGSQPQPGAPKELHPRGTRIGRFIVEGRLGEGGMGVVLLAKDPELDRSVALKLLRDGDSSTEDSGGRTRLLREAQAMARLSHPNVVTIYEVGTHGNQVFLALELVEGSTAKVWLKAQPRTWQEIVRAFLEAGRGLTAAHAKGFVHRDFKPDNVLISADGRVRVTDFGLARAVEAPDDLPVGPASSPGASPSLLASPLTQAGVVVGTIAYMSPEQYRGESIDARSDIYSFCVTLYEALFGVRPYRRPGETTVEPPAPGSTAPGWLRDVLLKGMAVDRERRYATMDELLLALSRDPAAPRKRVLLGAAAVVLLAGAGAGLYRFAAGGPASPCDDVDGTLATVWNDGVRQRLAGAFASTGDPEHLNRWTYAERALDGYAKLWRETATGACTAAAAQTKTESDTALRLKLECLMPRLAAFETVTGLLANADDALRDGAVVIVKDLPLPAECADARTLGGASQLPPAQHAERIAELRNVIVRANVKSTIGDSKGAIGDLKGVLEAVEKLGYPLLEAEVLLALASAQGSDGDWTTADKNYQRALDVAEKHHLDQLAAKAAVEVLAGLALSGQPLEKVDAAIEPTLRIIGRAGDGPPQQYLVAHALDVVYASTGRTEKALPYAKKALELIRQVNGPDSLREFMNLNNYGAAADTLGHYEEALKAWSDALALEQRVVGRARAGTGLVWANIVLTTSKMGNWEEAGRVCREVLPKSEKLGENAFTAMVQGVYANVLLEEGNAADGEKWMQRSVDLVRKLQMVGSPIGGEVLRQASEALLRLGRPKQAVALVDEMMANEKPRIPADSAEWVTPLKYAGAAYLANGEAGRAREVLERALALVKGQVVYPGWVPQMKFQLAQALPGAPADRARARQLVDEAEAELATLPQRKRLREAVVAWREKTFGR